MLDSIASKQLAFVRTTLLPACIVRADIVYGGICESGHLSTAQNLKNLLPEKDATW